MAIASAGYTGTVTQEKWAVMSTMAGADAVVAGLTDCAVSGVAGTRLVSVSPGTAWGWGVLDVLSGTNTVALAANNGAATRYDTVVLRRNWGTGTTTVASVSGGPTDVVAALTVSPGVQADQVLATVAVPVGATSLVGASVRARTLWPGQVTVGPEAPDTPSVGQVWVPTGAADIQRWTGSSWRSVMGPPFITAALPVGLTAGSPVGYRISGGDVRLHGEVRKASGFTTTTTLFTLPAGYRPAYALRVPASTGGTSGGATSVSIGTDGVVAVLPGEVTGTFTGVFLGAISFPIG